MIRRMLKYTLIVIVAIVIGYAGLTVRAIASKLSLAE